METNFIALVPDFPFVRRPTFVMACDVVGLHWLRDSFLCLVDAELQNTFVIGDGTPIASDDRCRLTVVKVRDEQVNEILPSDQSDFIWHVRPINAATFGAQLSSLLSSNIPGHQYLEVERGNHRTVVVTKHEYPVETIRAMRDGRTLAARGL
jgi:hypothetical protein